MAEGAHKITQNFEQELCRYTGAPYAVAVDNASNALFLCLHYENYVAKSISSKYITIPSRTYPSVPCEIIHAGLKVKFKKTKTKYLTGAYQLAPTKIWDSALRFTADMYANNSHMCVSFTGPYKHFKLSKGGAVLTDDKEAYLWLKRARFSGRRECPYDLDNLDMLGWNFYMMPELSARGLLLINQFYESDGSKRHNEDLKITYPDLSKFEVYKT
jgi:dTDP-4-amino-4,6-dideoxygalactose transaminase